MNITKTLSFALLTLLLSACTAGVSADNFRVAEELCQVHQGVRYVYASRTRGSGFVIDATCVDGVEINKHIPRQ